MIMPAILTFSNSLDALADRLLANLRQTGDDPFTTVSIATPASALRDWLKVRVAEKTGIAANLAFPPLERLLWDRLAERDRHREDPGRLPARLLDGFSFQGLVLSRLRHAPPEALKAYLGSLQPEDAARRLVQLAGQLASLFREYEYNRVAESHYPSLTDSWRNGEPNFERHLLRGTPSQAALSRLAEVREMEGWQMDVYRSLFRTGGLRDRWGESTKTYRYTLPQYADMALHEPLVPSDAGRVTHLFGLSNISPFHRDLIGRLADDGKLGEGAARFEIYALNPCAEYWEDLLTLRERRARGARRLAPSPVPPERVAATRPDAAELEAGELRDAAEENGLLALFGKPGRETIKLWCQLTGHDFNEDFHPPAAGTLLAAVQESTLRRAGPLAARVAPDASLRFLAAADPRAELEGVRAEIAAALRSDPSLRPEDLAIIPTDPAAALPLMRAVFAGDERAPGNVPILFPDGGPAEEGALLRGFRSLLALAIGELTRGAVLDLLGNPAVLRASGLEATRPSAVSDFLEEAGFNRGWDEAEDGASSLEAALERAILSFALDGNDAALEARVDLPQPVPGVPGRMDRAETGKLIDWLEALRTHLGPLRSGEARPFAEWAVLLRNIRDVFLNPDARDARDDLDLRRFLDELEGWAIGEESERDFADATLVTLLFTDRFRGEDGPGRSNFLRGGVRTGTLSALRGIPFRHVWILGLTGEFPSVGDAIPLDLRAFRRLPGESDPASRDLYALLEILTACTGSATLSWPRRGADGKDRRPSRALTGLMAWLESDILPEGATFDFEEMPKAPPAPPLPVERISATFAAEAAPDALRPVQKFRSLEVFLRNPVLHFVERILRPDDRDLLDDREPGISEDLFIDKWKGGALLDACLRAELLRPGAAVPTFERLWTFESRGGKVPPAPWGPLEEARLRERLLEATGSEAESLRLVLAGTRLSFAGSLRLGPQGAERPAPPVVNRPAFDAAPLGVNLKLGGILPWFFHGPGGWAILSRAGREATTYLIHLCAVALAPLPGALGETFKGRGWILLRAEEGGEITAVALPNLNRDEARRILSDLLRDYAKALRGEGHLDDVPLDAVEEILRTAQGDAEAVADWEEAVDDLRRKGEETGRERVSRPERTRRAVDPGLPADLREQVERRVLPYLRWRDALTDAIAAANGPDAGEAE